MAVAALAIWLNYFDPTIKLRLRLSVLAAVSALHLDFFFHKTCVLKIPLFRAVWLFSLRLPSSDTARRQR